MDTTIDAGDAVALRGLLGRFCTGVTVVATANTAGDVVGFACQPFSALSLAPPIILISVTRRSSAVPVLPGPESCPATVGSRAADKFARVPLTRTGSGLPALRDPLAWFDCSVARVVEGGDHIVVLADVREAGPTECDARPLLYYNGGYGGLARTEPATVTPERELLTAMSAYTTDDWF